MLWVISSAVYLLNETVKLLIITLKNLGCVDVGVLQKDILCHVGQVLENDPLGSPES